MRSQVIKWIFTQEYASKGSPWIAGPATKRGRGEGRKRGPAAVHPQDDLMIWGADQLREDSGCRGRRAEGPDELPFLDVGTKG